MTVTVLASLWSTTVLQQLHKEINRRCFGHRLNPVQIVAEHSLTYLAPKHPFSERNPEGEIAGFCAAVPEDDHKCVLHFLHALDEKEMLNTMAHEMVHQWLVQQYGYQHMLRVGHGPEFTKYDVWLRKWPGLAPLSDRY